MATLGLAPGYLGTNYQGLMIGCIMQMLLISLALGERWNVLVKENQEAKELELRRGQEENVRLEREVRIRTEELNLQNVQLEGLNQIKDKLFSVVSHDSKEPLTSLKLSLALVKMDKLTQQEFKEISGELEGHLDTTTDFIQNLLQWAKFQLRGEEIKPAAFELLPLLEETIALLTLNFKQKSITIKKEIDSINLTVFADIVMTQSILRNLLTNAVKFTPQDGTITVCASVNSKDKVIVSVTDTGMGIPESNRDKLFTLESIATKGTKSETGTGLGLVLCKEFVERNKGEIWFDTEDGKGTTFYISLPQPKEHKAKKLQPA
jgi:signal transduction histidine kinase